MEDEILSDSRNVDVNNNTRKLHDDSGIARILCNSSHDDIIQS